MTHHGSPGEVCPVQASKDQGISADLLAPLQALVDQRVAAGHRNDDISGVIELINMPSAADDRHSQRR